MSEKDEQTSQAVDEAESIQTESSPFELGYQPDSLPKISVPDLPDHAQGLSAEALSKVPTLTELVEDDAVDSTSAPNLADERAVLAEADAAEEALPIQDPPVQADTWIEELCVRMGKLTDDIQVLNARLDRLEEQNNTKA